MSAFDFEHDVLRCGQLRFLGSSTAALLSALFAISISSLFTLIHLVLAALTPYRLREADISILLKADITALVLHLLLLGLDEKHRKRYKSFPQFRVSYAVLQIGSMDK